MLEHGKPDTNRTCYLSKMREINMRGYREMLKYFLDPMVGIAPVDLRDRAIQLKQAGGVDRVIGEIINRMVREMINAQLLTIDTQN